MMSLLLRADALITRPFQWLVDFFERWPSWWVLQCAALMAVAALLAAAIAPFDVDAGWRLFWRLACAAIVVGEGVALASLEEQDVWAEDLLGSFSCWIRLLLMVSSGGFCALVLLLALLGSQFITASITMGFVWNAGALASAYFAACEPPPPPEEQDQHEPEFAA